MAGTRYPVALHVPERKQHFQFQNLRVAGWRMFDMMISSDFGRWGGADMLHELDGSALRGHDALPPAHH